MAKRKNANSKSKKKEVSKKIEKVESSVEKGLLKIIRILLGVIVVFVLFYLLTIFIIDKDEEEETTETAIQYEEILAGSSFTMRDDEYIVVYYDFTSEDADQISSAIYTYTSNYLGSSLRLYTVDMSNAFNEKYASKSKSNENPESAADLLINVPTIIRIKDGKAVEYIDDLDDVLDYLQ